MSMPLKARFAIAAVIFSCPFASAQSLKECIEQNRHPISLDEKGLSGPGADILLGHARDSEFTLIGESHGNRETCSVGSWLLENLKGAGYKAFVTETGPSSTSVLLDAAKDRGFEGVAQTIRETPFSVAFLNHKEDAALFAHAATMGYECWGIDQEFMGSPRLILGALKQRAETETARTAINSALENAWDGFKHYAQTGSREKAFMFTAGAGQWNQLLEVFDAGSNERKMIDQLRISQRIYGMYHKGDFFKSNSLRIDFMKRMFSERIQASPDCRVLLKIGSAHAGRGYSPFDQLDVGNHAAEMAFARGGKSLHVLVLARKLIESDGKATDLVSETSPIRHFSQPGNESESQLFHLAELRSILAESKTKTAYPELSNLAFRYDFLLVLPEFHPSEPLVSIPK
ncbi:MAG TPA: hypothetical protein PKN33_16525 [Phycisphaerae bacterium]|nr:hypothetical protein [Phycisphaerae bacterium]